MSTPVRFVINVEEGVVQSVQGDPLPEHIQVDFIVRDFDNIRAGDDDPLSGQEEPQLFYW
jgi:hypothetical protein